MTEHTFERRQHGRNHSYRLDGERCPGVTTLLGAGLPAPALVEWAAKTTATYGVENWDHLSTLPLIERWEAMRAARWTIFRAAGLRGTTIHGYAEQVSAGLEVDVPEDYAGPVEAVADLLDDLGITPVLTEVPIVNVDHRYAGTVDLVATINGERWLLDYKTGKGVYEKDALQVTAYNHATHYLEGTTLTPWVPAARVGLIHVTPDSAVLREVDATDYAFRVFLAVQQVADWLEAIKDEPIIGDALTPADLGVTP